jgi:hypothetical protein
MATVYDSNQTIFPGQYGSPSRQSFPGEYGSSGDRSRNSSSSFVNMELSPAMEFAFSSDSALSEPDMDCWMNLMVDTDPTSPMSNNLSEPEFFPNSWNSNNPSVSMAPGFDNPAAQRVATLGTFPQYQHSTRAPNQGKTFTSFIISRPCI